MEDKLLSYDEFCEQYYPRITTQQERDDMKRKGYDDEEYNLVTLAQYKMYFEGRR